MKVLCTPGFLAAAEKEVDLDEMEKLASDLCSAKEPSWIVGDPEATKTSLGDEGRTKRIPASFTFWAIRDDHQEDCSCGCEGQQIVTLLLPEDY